MVCPLLETRSLHSTSVSDTPKAVQTALSRAMLQPQVPCDLYEILGNMDFPSQLESLASATKIVHTQVGGGGPQRWDTEITKIMFHILKSVPRYPATTGCSNHCTDKRALKKLMTVVASFFAPELTLL
jgi:hypothetical protein